MISYYENSKFRKITALCICLLFTLAAWWRMLHFADNCGFFVDESVSFTAAAANFFRQLNYTGQTFNHPFDPRMSSGLAATWPTGLSWNAGYSIFTQRIFLIVYCWCQFNYSVFLLFKRWGLEKSLALAFTAFLWVIVLRHIPNTLGFIQNLGEVEAGICLIWSLVLFPIAPFWAFVFLGISVWMAKLVFLPAAFALGAAYWLGTAKWELKEILRFSKFIGAFFLPLALWILLISLRFGVEGLKTWFVEYYRFVFIEGPSGVSNAPKLTFEQRMNLLEWGKYNLSIKAKILLYTFGPVLTWPVLYFRGNRQEKWAAVLVPGVLLLYAYWWFFKNPEMYLRHFHPALFLGFGFLFYFVGKIVGYMWMKNRSAMVILIVSVLSGTFLLELRLLKRDNWPLWTGEITYARACHGPVWNEVCAPGFGFEPAPAKGETK